ncbi:GntP family permease [Brevibacillus centrosporus]|uniref:H+/gluconate symporter n=1 Tax=Brevibacillus centrosporus TaxID=54910 RepID=A0A1I4AP20_9BACL|nr:GntP family permease [Brevibacillus centrosporus]MEC2127980.1 GntP family permease [Brevibacillus centrosporus]MED4910716.1 GntP family permease [Brevibacillus centrosporus]RNB67644.1 GntP family permease [Brevibacillus centrosporus]SFK57416.1 H+/gluconate symporter [Brevibacillus centrosporus]GED30937.1 permease [Brevibacillus centrosporus]
MISMIGLIGGLALLIILTMRGMNLLIVAPFSALFVAVCNGLPLFPQLAAEGEANFVANYMSGFTGFITSWYLMFLIGAIFGKLMEDSGAADSVSKWIVEKIGMKNAALAIVIACAVLTYGGVSLFVVAFSVYPMAISLFREANLPRRFIPAALGFGSTTFTMTSAGSPEIQNWIPIPYLHTTPYAGWEVSLVVAVFMMIFGYWWLKRMIMKAVQKGERFVSRETDNRDVRENLPHPIVSMIPLLVVLVISFVFHNSLAQSALILALLGGVIATYLLHRKYFINFWHAVSEGTMGALIAIANTAAVVGFGGVAKATPAFASAVDMMTSIPGSPLIGSAVAVCIIAGLTGSASGGQTIALPLLAPHYMDMGVNPEALHRVVAISSGSLDSLPHGGYVVTTIRAIAGETHKDAYPAFGAMTVIVPIFGVILAVVLFSLGM